MDGLINDSDLTENELIHKEKRDKIYGYPDSKA
jgi:hypothetical protein